MKLTKKITSCILLAAMMTAITACDSEDPIGSGNSSAPSSGPSATTSATTVVTTDPDENAATDADVKEIGTAAYTPDGNSGKIVWLGYYDLQTDGSASEQYKIFTS